MRWWVVVAVSCVCIEAHAQQNTTAAPTDDSISRAEALYEKGNEFFLRNQYLSALAKFRRAVELWDHPKIRFNMAVCHAQLAEPIEAYRNLLEALRDSPFTGEKAEMATRMKSSLRAQIGLVRLRATQRGTAMTVDGQRLALDKQSADLLQYSRARTSSLQRSLATKRLPRPFL